MTLQRVLHWLALAFTAYFLVRGVMWATRVPHPWLQLASVAVWLLVVVALLWVKGTSPTSPGAEFRAPTRLPHAAAALALVGCVASSLLWVAASGERIADPPAAGVFGATGAALTIMAVRRRAEWAWGGVAALTIIGAIAYGPQTAFERGLVGDYLWVGIAQLMVWGMDRAYRDTARLAQLQQASSAWQATQEALRAQRRSRVRFALAEAGPILSRVIATGGRIDQAERDGALLAEATLRDELRATRLLDDDVRGAIRRARERGATVTVIDDDALGDLDAAELAVVRAELASAIDETDADRIIVRTTPEAGAAVTIVGRVVGDRAPGDEDAVATWHEIPRPG
ncbi:MAG: hypothetical protein ACTHZX_01320 [Microbacterium sp.]